MGKSRVPEIRFCGFTDDWEQRNLKDVADIYDGTHQTPEYTQSGVKFISVENIKDINRSKKFISKKDYKEQFKIKPQINDIFMTRITAGVIGETALLTENTDLAYYVSLALIRSQRINPLFLEKYIGSSQFKNELNKKIIHTAFPKKINLGDIGECKVSSPICDSEQKKLGIFLITLDNTITLHKQELDLLKQMKQGFLQKMFPKDGESVPEIRFPGYTDEWEQCKLGEVAKYRNGKAHENNISEQGKYLVVNSKFVSTDGEVYKYSDKQIEPLYQNEIAFVLSDVPNGRAIARTYLIEKDDKYTLNQRIAGITPNENVCPYFLHILMNRNKYFLQFDDGVKQTNLSINDVIEFEEYYPSESEQHKIGVYFEHLDNLITLHQQELDLLKQTKKAFIQKMLI